MPGFVGAKRSTGYGAAHARARKQWAAELAHAGSLPCTRCHRPVYDGSRWHLDHNDDRETYRGIAHATCNLKAGAALGGRRAAGARNVREGRAAAYW